MGDGLRIVSSIKRGRKLCVERASNDVAKHLEDSRLEALTDVRATPVSASMAMFRP